MDFSEKQTHHQQLYKQQLQWFESTGESTGVQEKVQENVEEKCVLTLFTLYTYKLEAISSHIYFYRKRLNHTE